MKSYYKTFLSLLLFLSTQALFSQAEICWNRIDDDGDGVIDCADSDCFDYNFCFECDERFYQVINNRYLATLDIENQWYKDIFVLRGIDQINGAAMNPIDGHVYASASANGDHLLVLVGNDGSLGNLGLTLPGSDVYFMATIDDGGIMYFSNQNSNILSVDLNQATLSWTDTGIPYPGAGSPGSVSRKNHDRNRPINPKKAIKNSQTHFVSRQSPLNCLMRCFSVDG